MKNTKTAIIGANGYIGKHLEFYLKRMGLDPRVTIYKMIVVKIISRLI